jgi:hypothetical protein
VFSNVPAGTYVLLSRGDVTQYGFGAIGTIPPVFSTGFGFNSDGIDGGPPGTVVFTESTGPRPTYFGRTTISVGSNDVSDVTLSMRPLATISGTFVRDDGMPLGNGFVGVSAEAANGDLANGIVRGNRTEPDAPTFTIAGVAPGDYVLSVNTFADRALSLRSIVVAGRDYADKPMPVTGDLSNVVITFTTQSTKVTGRVNSSVAGASPAAATVIAFPSEPEARTNVGLHPRRLKRVSVRTDGSYEIADLAPGRYELVAVPSGDIASWRDPKFLAAATARATPVTVEWNTPIQQTLSLETIR